MFEVKRLRGKVENIFWQIDFMRKCEKAQSFSFIETSYSTWTSSSCLHSDPYECWQEAALKNKVFLQPPWNFKKGVHNFNSVLCFFECTEWQPLSHQKQGMSRSCFTAREMLAYPLAYIISPAAHWWGGVVGDCAGRQVVKFPLAGQPLPPIWLAFSWAEVWQPIRPQGRLRSCQLRQQPLSHVCLLTDREATEASRKPKLLFSNGLQLTQITELRQRIWVNKDGD